MGWCVPNQNVKVFKWVSQYLPLCQTRLPKSRGNNLLPLINIPMSFQAPRINTQLHTVPLPPPHFIASFLNPNTPPPPPLPHTCRNTISRQRSPTQVWKILKHHRPKCPRIDITSPLTKAITYPEKTSCRISCTTIWKEELPEDFAGGERR